VLQRATREAPLVASTCSILGAALVSLFKSPRFVDNVGSASFCRDLDSVILALVTHALLFPLPLSQTKARGIEMHFNINNESYDTEIYCRSTVGEGTVRTQAHKHWFIYRMNMYFRRIATRRYHRIDVQ
jgi:hypothetical protein